MSKKMYWCLSMIAAVCFVGLSACAESPEEDPGPVLESAAEVELPDDEAPTSDNVGGGLCCIDYSCPTNGYEATGCKGAGSSIGAAYRLCDAACNVACKSSGLICD